MRKNLLLTIFAFCCFSIGFSQADCANALALTPGMAQSGDSAGQAGDFDGGGAAPNNPCNTNYNDDEYWFEYTATETGETLQLDVTNITETWAGVFVIDDCPSGTPNCVASATNDGSTADLSVTTPALTAGTSYKIFISNWGTPNNTAFTLNSTVIAAPSCLDPTNLSVSIAMGAISADLSWDAEPGASLGYNWVVMNSGEDPTVDTPVDSGATGAGVTMATATGLTMATEYDFYVQSNCDTNGLSGFAGPVSFFTVEAPANDECDNAVVLTVNPDFSNTSVTAGTTAGATASSQADDVTGTPNTDVWYSFVATSDAHRIELLNVVNVGGGTSTSTDMGMGVYDGTGGCAGLVLFDDSDPNTLNLTGLTMGTTYIVRVYGWGTTIQFNDFDISVGTPPAAPANDDCAGAEMLTVNLDGSCTVTTMGTLVSSTDSAVATSCDAAGTELDVWYSFVAPASGNVDFSVTLGTNGPLEYAIFDDCMGTTEIACADPLDGTSITGLTPGTTYYLLVWIDDFETPGDFTICASQPTCTPATVTYTAIDDCAMSDGFNIEVDITDMGTATDITVSDDQGSADQTTMMATTLTFGPYPSGTDVIITVADDNDANCNQSSSALTFECPPANDDFANAIAVNCDDNVTGSTSAATLDEDDAPDNSAADLDAPNVWYTYTGSGTPEDITLNLCPSAYDTSVLVYTGTSGNLTLVAANDDGGTTNCPGAGTRSFLTFQSDGTTTYYITIEGWNVGSVGDYDMTVTCVAQTPPPANDECADAEMLTLGVTASGTTIGATVDVADDNPSCESTFATIVDVWYSVDITGGNSDLTIDTTITGTSDQANVAVYTDCTLATELGCSDANGGESLTVTGLDNGTYIVRVWGDGVAARTEGTFDIVANATLSTESFDEESAFTYYPNPVKNTLTLNAQNTIENVTIYNMLGQKVLSAMPNTVNSDIDMSSLQDGAYFVRVTIANITQTIRVIKQ